MLVTACRQSGLHQVPVVVLPVRGLVAVVLPWLVQRLLPEFPSFSLLARPGGRRRRSTDAALTVQLPTVPVQSVPLSAGRP
jgi:hypothetical protein